MGQKKMLPTNKESISKHLKRLLNLIKLKRTFGVYVEDNKLYFAEVVRTPTGSFLKRKACGDLSKGQFRDYMNKLFPAKTPNNSTKDKGHSKILEGRIFSLFEDLKKKFTKPHKKPAKNPVKKPVKKKKSSTIVATAIPGRELFYVSSPISDEAVKKLDMQALIDENPRFAFVSSSDVVSNWFFSKLRGQSFVFVGAAKRNRVEKTLKDFYSANLQPLRIEPEPWAVLRASLYFTRSKAGKGALEIRFLFGEKTILAILTNGKIPLAWQYHILNEDINNILYSVCNSLMIYTYSRLKVGEIKTIVLQGTGNLSNLAKMLEKEIALPVLVSSGPSYDGHLVAFGLALGALSSDTQDINLALTIQKPSSLMAIFPRFEAILTGALVLFVLFNTWGNIDKYSRRLRSVKMENALSGWSMGKNLFILNAEKSKILKQVEPMGYFLADKMNWSPYLESLAELIPHNAKVISIEAEDQIWKKTVSPKGDRYFLVRIAAIFPPGGKAPEEIDRSIAAFRDHPLFKKKLPRVRLAEINWKKEGTREEAYFTVFSTPKTKKGKRGKRKK